MGILLFWAQLSTCLTAIIFEFSNYYYHKQICPIAYPPGHFHMSNIQLIFSVLPHTRYSFTFPPHPTMKLENFYNNVWFCCVVLYYDLLWIHKLLSPGFLDISRVDINSTKRSKLV